MTKDECPKCHGTNWSRWMKRQDRKDHRQYKFCLDCYCVVNREQPKPIKEKLSRRWRAGVY